MQAAGCTCGLSGHPLWGLRPPPYLGELQGETFPGEIVFRHDELIRETGFALDFPAGFRVWDPSRTCRNCLFWTAKFAGPESPSLPQHNVRPSAVDMAGTPAETDIAGFHRGCHHVAWATPSCKMILEAGGWVLATMSVARCSGVPTGRCGAVQSSPSALDVIQEAAGVTATLFPSDVGVSGASQGGRDLLTVFRRMHDRVGVDFSTRASQDRVAGGSADSACCSGACDMEVDLPGLRRHGENLSEVVILREEVTSGGLLRLRTVEARDLPAWLRFFAFQYVVGREVCPECWIQVGLESRRWLCQGL